MFALTLYPEAQNRLAEEQRNGLGDEFILSFEACINYIQRNLSAFQKRYKNYHLGLLERFPYGLFYLINKKEKVILAATVYHLSMNPKSIRKKLP